MPLMLKITIIVLMIAVVISLMTGFKFLMKDRGETDKSLMALKIRVVLAVVLMTVIGYGLYTGKIDNSSPWGRGQVATPPPAPESAP